jgi:hypothetical protein
MTRRLATIVAVTLVWCVLSGGSNRLVAQNLRVQGGNITLTVVTGLPDGEPVAVTSTLASLRYRTQTVITKITVQSSCPAQKFTLKVAVTSTTGGTAQPEITLFDGMSPTNLILNIPTSNPKNRTAALQYTGSATFAQGNSTELGSDIHTVTYTLLAQ